ncbi:MAG: MFS transporter [Chloroflexi bacterium]|jgi:MFS family permease|nr:MFS transporter [Chloroflexota bacterium]
MNRPIRWHDYITINIYWLGIMAVSQANGLIQPLLVQRFISQEQQGTYYGNMRLYSLMTALLVQALAGMLSDRNMSKWGRRRPYILAGALLNVIFLFAMSASPGYWFLFTAVVLVQLASNLSHGAQQGLIPDLVPEDRRGRFSGIKAVLELLPVIIIALTIGPMIAVGNMLGGIAVVVLILLLTAGITMFVREQPLAEKPAQLEWKSFGRLAAMTLLFLVIILLSGETVQYIGKLFDPAAALSTQVFVMGLVGLVGMLIAVFFGVYGSIQVSIGRQAASTNPAFTWWVINRLAFLVGANNLAAFAVYFLQGRLGLEGDAAAGPASTLKLVVGVLILVFALPSGWLADKVGRKRLVALSGILATAGTVILLLSPTLNVIMIGGSIVGAGIGMFFATSWALGTDIVPKRAAGKFLGISNLAGAGAGAVGAYIGGPIADYFTIHFPQLPGLGYMVIFGIYAALFLISTIVLIKVPEPRI